MKTVIFLGDGMSDRPVPELGGATPLQKARKPHMDRIAREGFCGLVSTVPEGIDVGSDTANMAVMGYDPAEYYTGRSPLEAIGMAIEMSDGDTAYRCNLVTLSDSAETDEYARRIMLDHSADEIASDEAARLVETLNSELGTDRWRLHPGKSYRHCLIWSDGPEDVQLTPPHDILQRVIGDYLPSGTDAAPLLDLMRRSADVLDAHPVNQARRRRLLRPGNAAWIWGRGSKPNLPPIATRYGLRGSVISAVDLVNGLGICAGLRVIDVPGATGTIHTNYRGKGEAAVRELFSGQNYVFIHVEAPDESGHRHEIDNKILAIEQIDEHIVGPVWQSLEDGFQSDGTPYRLLLMPDHATPLTLRTHARDPVPFAIFDRTGSLRRAAAAYDETSCAATGFMLTEGWQLFGSLIEGTIPE